MLKLTRDSSAIDLSVMRIALSGYMLSQYHLLKDILFMQSAVEYFKPIGVFRILSQPIATQSLELLFHCWVGASLFMLLGLFTRTVGPLWFLLSMVVLGYESNFGSVSNSTQLIVLASLIISMSYCADTLSLDALIFKKIEREPWNYYWPKMTLQMLVVLSFCTLGLQKLYYQGLQWVFSDKLYLTIFVNPEHTAVGSWILEQPVYVSQILAFVVVFIVECSAPLALMRPFNCIYPLIWTAFHIGLSLTLGGFQTFYLQIPVYLCFYSFSFLEIHKKKSVPE